MRRYENIWHKRQLVPCWVLQCLASGIFLIAAGLLIAAAAYIKNHDVDSDYRYYGYSADELANYAAAAGAITFVFGFATIIIDIIEAVLYARRVLSPVVLLVFAVLKTLAWGIYFVLAIISAARGSVSWLDFLLGLIVVGTSIIQLVLGAKYTHRRNKGTLDNRGTYKPTTASHVEGAAYNTYPQQQTGYPSAYAQPQQPGVQNPFNDQTYRSTGPVSSYGPAQHGVELQQQKPAHY
jgi:hypothetical protein